MFVAVVATAGGDGGGDGADGVGGDGVAVAGVTGPSSMWFETRRFWVLELLLVLEVGGSACSLAITSHFA